MGAGGMSVAAILASSMVNSRARAFVEDSTVTAGGDVAVAASDEARIVSSSAMYSEVAPANDAGAGILNGWANHSLSEYDFTQHSGERDVVFGDTVRADDGTVYQYMGTSRSVDFATEDLTDFGWWKALTPVNLITDSVAYAALSSLGNTFGSELAGSADSYFGLVDHNDLRSIVEAYLLRSPVTTSGDVTVSALETAELVAFDDSVTSSWTGKGAVVVTNVLLSSATAYVEDGDVEAGERHGRRPEHVDARRDGELEDRVVGQRERRRGVQLDRLEAVERPLQPRRRARRRPADLERVRRAAAVRGDGLPARRRSHGVRRPRRHRHAGGAAHRGLGERERGRGRDRHRLRLRVGGRGRLRRRDRRLRTRWRRRPRRSSSSLARRARSSPPKCSSRPATRPASTRPRP